MPRAEVPKSNFYLTLEGRLWGVVPFKFTPVILRGLRPEDALGIVGYCLSHGGFVGTTSSAAERTENLPLLGRTLIRASAREG